MQTNDAEQYIKWAREVLQIEADGLKEISDGLNGNNQANGGTSEPNCFNSAAVS